MFAIEPLAASTDLTPTSHVAPALDVRNAQVTALGDAIADLAAHLHAATYELLVLLREFDARAGWNTGFQSCAHWLHWRTGIDLGAAREKVRVARALGDLPLLSAAMARGELAYAKVRAVTRVATPATEAALVDVARCGTTAHVERLVRAWRRVDRIEAAQETTRRHQDRQLQAWMDEDGMVVLRGRLAPEAGAVVLRALEAAADRLITESAQTPLPASVAEEVTSAQRRADALALVAESALAADLDRGTAGDRYQVVLHVDPDALAAEAPPGDVVPAHRSREAVSTRGQATLEDGPYVSWETSRRLACDAAVVVMRHAPDGSVLDVGRKTRTIPPAIRRALAARDPRCRFPGCAARYGDAHHVRHWADGGETRLDNLVRLCRRHHRLVHEDGWTLTRRADGDVVFTRPDGTLLDPVPSPPIVTGPPLASTTVRLAAAGIRIGPYMATPAWTGERFDVGWALDVLRGRRFDAEESMLAE